MFSLSKTVFSLLLNLTEPKVIDIPKLRQMLDSNFLGDLLSLLDEDPRKRDSARASLEVFSLAPTPVPDAFRSGLPLPMSIQTMLSSFSFDLMRISAATSHPKAAEMLPCVSALRQEGIRRQGARTQVPSTSRTASRALLSLLALLRPSLTGPRVQRNHHRLLELRSLPHTPLLLLAQSPLCLLAGTRAVATLTITGVFFVSDLQKPLKLRLILLKLGWSLLTRAAVILLIAVRESRKQPSWYDGPELYLRQAFVFTHFL